MRHSSGELVRTRSSQAGVTLIELMIAITLLAIIASVAVPSFVEVRERAVLRGAADQLVSFWATARFEAVKRSSRVKVSFVRDAGGQMCLGASMTATDGDDTACDCFTAGACNVATFPDAQARWSGTSWVAAPSFGDSNSGVLVIDPKTGFLTQASDDGALTIRSSGRDNHYRLRLVIDPLGRAALCEPTDAPRALPDYGARSC